MNTKQIHLEAQIPAELAGLRLDQALVKLWPQYSRSQYQHWIKLGCVQLSNETCMQSKIKVSAHQMLQLTAELSAQTDWSAQDIPLNILFEDADVLVINKPAGLVVHPGAGNPDQTLVNALLHHAPELAEVPRAGVIHRLDKDTSGLLIIAKNLSAHHFLTQALKDRHIKREYLALVKGEMTGGGTVDAPMGRHPTQRTKMAINPMGRTAITHYRIKERFNHYTLLDVTLETGRTHQIRVHMEHIRHPVFGDPSYGRHMALPARIDPALKIVLQQFNRQALHALRLTFQHPSTQKDLRFEAPLPADFLGLLDCLRNYD